MKAIILAIFALLGVVTVMATPVQEIRFQRGPGLNQEECPGSDPSEKPPGPYNFGFAPLFDLLEGSHHQGLIVAGHSFIESDVNIVIITLTVRFEVKIPKLNLDVVQAVASGYLDIRPFTFLPQGNYTGTGNNKVELTALEIQGSATLFINIIGDKVSIRLLTVNTLRFDGLCMDLGEDFRIGGSPDPVDWADLCANVKVRFDADWANTGFKNLFVDKIRVSLNVIVGQYTLQELIDLIGGGDGEPVTGEPGVTGEPCFAAKKAIS